MPKTLQIRDIDDDVYAGLQRRAAEDGVTVPELLRREATKLASRPSMKAWYAEIRRQNRSLNMTTEEVIAAFDEHRGPWPDGDR